MSRRSNLLGAALAMAVLTAFAGLIDFLGDRSIRALSTAWLHFLGNGIAVVLALLNFGDTARSTSRLWTKTPLAEAHGPRLALFEREGRSVTVDAVEDATILLLSGTPIDEPVVGYGPFVMKQPSRDPPGRQRLPERQDGASDGADLAGSPHHAGQSDRANGSLAL